MERYSGFTFSALSRLKHSAATELVFKSDAPLEVKKIEESLRRVGLPEDAPLKAKPIEGRFLGLFTDRRWVRKAKELLHRVKDWKAASYLQVERLGNGWWITHNKNVIDSDMDKEHYTIVTEPTRWKITRRVGRDVADMLERVGEISDGFNPWEVNADIIDKAGWTRGYENSRVDEIGFQFSSWDRAPWDKMDELVWASPRKHIHLEWRDGTLSLDKKDVLEEGSLKKAAESERKFSRIKRSDLFQKAVQAVYTAAKKKYCEAEV